MSDSDTFAFAFLCGNFKEKLIKMRNKTMFFMPPKEKAVPTLPKETFMIPKRLLESNQSEFDTNAVIRERKTYRVLKASSVAILNDFKALQPPVAKSKSKIHLYAKDKVL